MVLFYPRPLLQFLPKFGLNPSSDNIYPEVIEEKSYIFLYHKQLIYTQMNPKETRKEYGIS